MRFSTLLLLSYAALTLSACGPMSRSDRAVIGGVLGAGIGAAIDPSAGAVIGGAAAGAAAGAVTY